LTPGGKANLAVVGLPAGKEAATGCRFRVLKPSHQKVRSNGRSVAGW
jgi:hypothetical protein